MNGDSKEYPEKYPEKYPIIYYIGPADSIAKKWPKTGKRTKTTLRDPQRAEHAFSLPLSFGTAAGAPRQGNRGSTRRPLHFP